MTQPLVYFGTTSLDLYRTGPDGGFDFAAPDEEVHEFVNELFGTTKLHLYGRRNYEVMTWWDTVDADELEGASRGWAELWTGVHKVVYSTTLTEVTTPRTELRNSFDADEVRRWKEEADAPIAIAGGVLASEAARAGLLDELHVILAPVVLGGGSPFLDDGVDLSLELLDERRFGNGFVYLRYAVHHPSP